LISQAIIVRKSYELDESILSMSETGQTNQTIDLNIGNEEESEETEVKVPFGGYAIID
jgi:hypothetical protein